MGTCVSFQERYDLHTLKGKGAVMPKINPLTIEEIREALSYDPDTGSLIWRINSSKSVKAGSAAGCPKGARLNRTTGKTARYVYVRLNNIDTPAARIVWALHYGAFPEGNLLFRDGDTENLRIDNLRQAEKSVVTTGSDGVKSRKMTKEAQRHYGLRRYYGLTGEDYGRKMAEQKGLCAICAKPETAMFNGVPKVMHVDHDHETGAIRDLLCGSCNAMLGHAKDSPATLRAAADYIERHAAKVVSIGARRAGASDGET